MVRHIHIVPHFHWDREWYFTAEESQILLAVDMEEILNRLETDPEYPCFVLDGQTAVLEDYLEAVPENEARLRRLIQEGRLIAGPWYTQTDEMVVGGESIVRNLLYGKQDCEKLGPRMMIGYLPDSFGQSARLPQILNGFGITRAIFWRGVSERMGTSRTEFYWEGDGKARVAVQLLPLGYAIGKYLPKEREALEGRLSKYLPVLEKGTATGYVLIPNGHDQMPLQKNIFQVMDQIRSLYPQCEVSIGRYEELFEKIEGAEGLDTLRGEFLDGKYMRVHRSIYSSRADLKAANTRIENEITCLLEPLASIAYSLGFPYYHGIIEKIWKGLLKNHAHDSMGCCCSDPVHRAIKERFVLAHQGAKHLIGLYQRQIAQALDGPEDQERWVVFNTLPYEREEVVTGEITTRKKGFYLTDHRGERIHFQILSEETIDPGLVDRQIVHYGNYEPFVRCRIALLDRFPAMGFKAYRIQEEEPAERAGMVGKPEGSPVLENERYRIEIRENGSLDIEDKQSGALYTGVLTVEDGSDGGDGYDYSPIEEDWVLTSREAKAQTEILSRGLVSEAKVSFSMPVPKDIESRRKRRTDGRLEVVFYIELRQGSPLIRIRMEADNQAKDHRVRLLIPAGGGTDRSVCDNQFGRIARPARDAAMEVWEQEKWSERPDSIYPFLSFVHTGNREGLAFLTNSVREYELTGEDYNTIAVTMFRCVGVLGREELLRRPGRPSGIKMETPDSQMQGRQVYEFALTGDCLQAAGRAREFVSPLTAYNRMAYHAMKLNCPEQTVPWEYSLLSMDNRSVTMSTLKKEEQGEGLLFRCYNAGEETQEGTVTGKWKAVGRCRLDETLQEDFGNEPGRLSLGPNETVTVRLMGERSQ